MNPTGQSHFNQARIEWAIRLKYSPMPSLDMEILARQLNEFRIGEFREIGKTWEVMMERDGELAVNSDKRKSDAAGLEWQIVSDGSIDGDKHAAALQYFYENLTATEALDQDVTGGVDELVYQVMSAVDNKYSTHEMLLRVDNPAAKEVTAEFRHTPLWFMESRRGYLGYLQHIFELYGQPCIQGEWLTAVNTGWMRQLSMAYAMKMFPLRDWLLFCTRYGSGFLVGQTEGSPGDENWTQAEQALEQLANDGAVLVNNGIEFKFLEQSARNSLPFEPIVERIDRLYAKCYRGVDLATSSRQGKSGGQGGPAVGASVQSEESGIFLLRDAKWTTGVMNERVDRPMIRYLFNQEPRAWFVLMPPLDDTSAEDLQSLQALVPMGFKVMMKEVYKRFRWSVPEAGEPCLASAAPAALPTAPENQTSKAGEDDKNEDKQPAAPPATPPEPKKPLDGAGEETEALITEKKDANATKTATAQTEEFTPIGSGADPKRWQAASGLMPDTQVDAASFWSRDATLPKSADGQALPMPSLGYALPNARFEKLSELGLGGTRAAQALRSTIRKAKVEIQSTALANAGDVTARLGSELHASIAPVLKRLEKIAQLKDPAMQHHLIEKLIADFPALTAAIKADDSFKDQLTPELMQNFLGGLKTQQTK
jgi:phage gp29-like protein